ncbi:MAG: hypothetical protein RL011_299 [Pseudomonadota bacterium]
MQSKLRFFSWLFLLALGACSGSHFSMSQADNATAEGHGIAVLFAGGPVYKARETSIPEIKNSGFTHLIVWTIHIEANGDLGFNGEFPLVKDGEYIGDAAYPQFRADMAALKRGPGAIQRLEFALSAAGSGTYDHIRRLVTCSESQCGLGPESVLYRNFAALLSAFPGVDAISNDDERVYDLATAVPFHAMLAGLGVKTSIAPYTNNGFWASFVKGLNLAQPGSADLTYLQVYDGGAGNDPCSWQLGIPVVPGFWSKYTEPNAAGARLKTWSERCQLAGGFLWLYDEVIGTRLVKDYASSLTGG